MKLNILTGELPIDVRLSKLIILGYTFKVMQSATIIAAGLSVRSIFQQKCQSRSEAFDDKFKLGCGSSDCTAILNVYNDWREQFYGRGRDVKNVKAEKDYCIKNMLDLKNLNEMHKQYEDISKRLKQTQFFDSDCVEDVNEKTFVLKMCIAGAFYPNLYIFGGQIPDRDSFNTLNYKNPCTTVFYKGFNINNGNMGDIYKDQIIHHLLQNDIIKHYEDAHVQFDTNSSRVYVTFKNYREEKVTVPGEVCFEVYKALRFAQMQGKKKLTLHVMDWRTEKEYLKRKSINDGSIKIGNNGDSWCIYPKAKEIVQGRITHVVSPGQFFIQTKKANDNIHRFEGRALKAECLTKINDPEEFAENNLIILKEKNRFLRAQVIAKATHQTDKPFKVRLIDYGNLVDCSLDELYTCIGFNRASRRELLRIVFHYPPMCFEAKLAKCKPNVLSQAGWSSKATGLFKDLICKENFEPIIEVYSFNKYDRMASVILRSTQNRISFQKMMNEENLCDLANESYIYMIERVADEKNTNPKNDHFNFADHSDAPRGRIPMTLTGPLSILSDPTFERTLKFSEGEIKTDSFSVNGILLDPFPFDGIRKVIVAANRTKNNKGKINLRQTTIMPHVLGLSCLLPLIFCPTAELKYDKHFSRFTSVLCGLGCKFDGDPYYMEHDSLFPVDINLDVEDIKLINDLRASMSELLGNFKENSEQVRSYLRDNALQTLIKIMTKTRIQSVGKLCDNYIWDGKNSVKADKNEINKIFPTIVQRRNLVPISLERWKMLTRMNDDLEKKAKFNTRDEIIKCLLCEEEMESLIELQIHVLYSKHLKLANQLAAQKPIQKRAYDCDDDNKRNIFGGGSCQKITKYQ
jgi:ATP-dependent RNA helicase TDRD9